jgi:hypothetical protein
MAPRVWARHILARRISTPLSTTAAAPASRLAIIASVKTCTARAVAPTSSPHR